MVKRSTGVARTVWVAKSECCQKQYYSNIRFSTWLKLLPLALCVNKFPHTRLLAIFNGASVIWDYLVCAPITKGDIKNNRHCQNYS